MPRLSRCHTVKSYCHTDKRLKGSGNCTRNGKKGTMVRSHKRPKKVCSSVKLQALVRGFLSRSRKKKSKTSEKKKKKKSTKKKKKSMSSFVNQYKLRPKSKK